MKCFKTFIGSSSTGEELSCPSSRHMWVSPRYVPQRLTLELPTKCKFWVYPLSMIIGCWTVRRDIHSIWIVSIPALDAEWRWEKLLTVSDSHLWVSQCNYQQLLTLKLPIKYPVFSTLSVQKMGQERHPLLMKCFKTFPRCIKLIGGAVLAMHLSTIHGSHQDIFHQGWLSKCTQNAKF